MSEGRIICIQSCLSTRRKKEFMSILKSVSKFHSLNFHSESHLQKKKSFLSFSISNNFPISCLHSRQIFSLHNFIQREIQNRCQMYLDNHLEKLSVAQCFSIKISIYNIQSGYREHLIVAPKFDLFVHYLKTK